MNKKKGIAIIGTGAIAKAHIEGYLALDSMCEIRALCDIYPEKGEALKEEFSLSHATIYADYHEMLENDNIDVVSICLPPSVHAPVSIDAMNAKKHVLVEKPMAPSLAECDAMILASNENGVLLSPVAQNRFKTDSMKLKKMLDQQVSGKVLHAVVNSLWYRGGNYYDLWWRGTWEKECGGVMTSHAVHQIDLLLWMVGMPLEVTAVISNVGHDNSECEDIGIAILRYKEMIGQITSSLVAHDEGQELIFHTEKAQLSLPYRSYCSSPLENGFPEDDETAKKNIDNIYHSMEECEITGHSAQISNFLHAIDGKEDLLIDGEQGRSTIELIHAIYLSAISRQTIALPLSKDNKMYTREGLIESMPHFYEKKKSVENFATNTITYGKDKRT